MGVRSPLQRQSAPASARHAQGDKTGIPLHSLRLTGDELWVSFHSILSSIAFANLVCFLLRVQVTL